METLFCVVDACDESQIQRIIDKIRGQVITDIRWISRPGGGFDVAVDVSGCQSLNKRLTHAIGKETRI